MLAGKTPETYLSRGSRPGGTPRSQARVQSQIRSCSSASPGPDARRGRVCAPPTPTRPTGESARMQRNTPSPLTGRLIKLTAAALIGFAAGAAPASEPAHTITKPPPTKAGDGKTGDTKADQAKA